MSEVIVRMKKVPKNCDDSCWGYLSGECPWSDHVDGYTMNGDRPRNCPIVGVLPDEHGDLIDKETAKNAFDSSFLTFRMKDGETMRGFYQRTIDELPVLIVAERSET